VQVQEQKLDCLEQTITIMSNSMVNLICLMRGTNRDREEERNMLGDLTRGKPIPISIPKDSPR
jgi:hypothetical protein